MRASIVNSSRCVKGCRNVPPERLLEGLLLALLVAIVGCGGGKPRDKRNAFFTSGNREADQRAEQKMAKAEQLASSTEGDGVRAGKENEGHQPTEGSATEQAIVAPDKLTLFDRLGGEIGISNIVADFLPRALNDPRVNWERKGIGGGLFRRQTEAAWKPTLENLSILERHLCQFIALATGGPSRYDGKSITAAHEDMKITNPEFDATVGDLKASLDRLKIANREQKELLAIIESTRPQIVTER